MTLLVVEGFDNAVASGNYSIPGWSWSGGQPNYTSTGARFGGTAVQISSGNLLLCPVPATGATDVIFGGSLVTGVNVTAQAVTVYGDGGTTTQHLTLMRGLDGSFTLRRGSSSGTVLASSAAGVFQAAVSGYLEMKVRIADAGGRCVVRYNEAVVIDYTGDTKNGGTLDAVSAIGFGQGWWDDIYVCNNLGSVNNDFLGDMRVITLLPDGNDVTTGVGSDGNSVDNYLLVNEPYLAGDTVYVDIPLGSTETYAYSNLPGNLGASAAIFGVQVTSVLSKTDTGAASGAAVSKIGGDVNVGAVRPLGTPSFTTYRDVFESRPAGGSWTQADVNSATFGVSAT